MPSLGLSADTDLARAARGERRAVDHQQRRIFERIAALEAELEALRSAQASLKDRAKLLDKLLASQDGSADGLVLQGSELRAQSVRILATEVGFDRPIGYREWFALVERAGFVVLAKRPLATFLTAVGRSPLIRKGDEPGTYLLDPSAADDLRRELGERQAEFRDLEQHIAERGAHAPLQRHRLGLMASIRRLERQVAEADRIISAHREKLFAAAPRAA